MKPAYAYRYVPAAADFAVVVVVVVPEERLAADDDAAVAVTLDALDAPEPAVVTAASDCGCDAAGCNGVEAAPAVFSDEEAATSCGSTGDLPLLRAEMPMALPMMTTHSTRTTM